MTGAAHTMAAKIATLALPLVQSMGLELWGVEYLIGKRILLRVYIDAPGATCAAGESGGQAPCPDASETPEAEQPQLPGLSRQGVDVEHCAYLSRHLGLALEAEDFIPSAYTLEVSSPGLTRPFFTAAQLAQFVGREVEATLYGPDVEAFPGRKRFTGRLLAVENERVLLDVDGREASFLWSAVKKAHLTYTFPDPQDKKRGTKKGAKQPS